MRKLSLILCAAATAGMLAAAPERDDSRFPVLAWGTNQHLAPAGAPLTVERFREMAECGITIAGFALDRAELDMIHEAGLTAYFQEWDITSIPWTSADPSTFQAKVDRMVEKVGDHPALYGYMLADEPTVAAFANQSRMYDLIRRSDPERDIYVNLYPNYVSMQHLGVGSYREYLTRFVTEYRPYWLGYDYYALIENVPALRGDFWLNLEEARETALAAGIPFHICTQGVAHFEMRAPSLEDLYLEIYSGLLYGARQIDIFTYFSPDCGNYRGAAINGGGDKTPTWHALKEVLGTVHTVAPVLNHLNSTRVYHIPHIAAEKGTRPAPADSLISDIVTWGEPRFAVGEFIHDATGEQYVMIQNKSLTHSVAIDKIQWRRTPAEISVVSQTRPGVLRAFGGEEYWIAPGRAVLLKVRF